MEVGQFYAHGDKLTILVDDKSIAGIENAKPIKSKVPGRTIIAYGEVTGHHHSIDESVARLFDASGITIPKVGAFHSDDQAESVLVMERPGTLEHQEHGPIDIDSGVYVVTGQFQYTAGDIKKVRD